MKKFCELNEDEIKELSKKSFSLYPFIFYKLMRYKNINFEFSEEYKSLENSLKHFLETRLPEEQYNLYVQSVIKDLTTKKLNEHDNKKFENPFFIIKNNKFYEELDLSILLKEFSKLFFPYYQSIDYRVRERFQHLKSHLYVIEHPEEYSKEDLEKSLIFTHDGWWNNYYSPLVDDYSRERLLEFLHNKKEKKLKKKTEYIYYLRSNLTLAYRLAEIDKVNEGKKIVKKILRTCNLHLFLNELKDAPIYLTGFKKIIISYVISFGDRARYKLNLLFFLYKSETNNRKKLKYIKKLDKLTSELKLNIQKFSTFIFKLKSFYNISLRPQHLLKVIEYKIDKYKIKPSKKLIGEINYNLIEAIKVIISNYYSKEDFWINFFINTELFFIIFYYLETVYNIDIQNY